MITGQCRMAAFGLLSQQDPSYSKIPCRFASDVSDEQALVLLHTANFFTRSLTVTERAAATKTLCIQVEQMRAADPSLAGMRTEDVKARIVEEMTGHKVSGKTIKREEALGRFVASILRNPSPADSEAIFRIAELARQAGDAVQGFTDVHGARRNPSDSNRSE